VRHFKIKDGCLLKIKTKHIHLDFIDIKYIYNNAFVNYINN